MGQTIKLLLVSVLKGWVVFNPNQKEDLLLQISAGVLKIYTGNTFCGEQGFDVKSTQHVSQAGGVTRSRVSAGMCSLSFLPMSSIKTQQSLRVFQNLNSKLRNLIFFYNCRPTLKSIKNKSNKLQERVGGGNNQVWKNYSALPLFIYFFFSFRSLKLNGKRGKCGGEGAEFPVPNQGALSGLWSPGRLRLLLPFVVWDWGQWRRSQSPLLPGSPRNNTGSCCFELLPVYFHVEF